MLRSVAALLALTMLVMLHGSAAAHKPSDSYLTLTTTGGAVSGQWDIALRDLDYAIGLDGNQDNSITWGEVKAKQAEITAYALSRLEISFASRCSPELQAFLIDNHSDGAYAVLRFAADCPRIGDTLNIDYHLLFDVDPQHRGLLNLTTDGGNRSAVFSADAPSQHFNLGEVSRSTQFVSYVREGIHHIWTGLDHVLFLLSLLLPAVLMRAPALGWVAAPSFKAAFFNVFKVVTAFTLAHSVTLSLATLGIISLPTRIVESAIAATVVLAALNNIRTVFHEGRWIVAFCFGLIHGFGYASVLGDLGLPAATLLLALVAFNAGVELGQLAIALVFLPAAWSMAGSSFYSRYVLRGGSLAIALCAAIWFLQRAFNVVLLPVLGS